MPPMTATYRVQLHRDFGFAAAQSLLPYLTALGISDLYLSPVAEAQPGSAHGYDVLDPTRISAERGGLSGFRALAAAARHMGIGIIIDIVPNHQAAHERNPAWQRVLRDGPGATTAPWFDIVWDAPWPAVRQRVTLPVLAEHYVDALRSGKLTLQWHATDGLVVAYSDRLFPINQTGWLQFLEAVLAQPLPKAVHQALAALRWRLAAGTGSVAEASAIVRGLTTTEPSVAQAIAAALTWFHPVSDQAAQERLDALLNNQHYRLCFWRSGQQFLTTRRFFDITELVGIRQEDQRVREATHRLVLNLLDAQPVRGLRVDHIDGLADPTAYLHWLRQQIDTRVGQSGTLLVEKILTGDEQLPADWPVDGTTGYDFLAHCTRVFLEPAGAERLYHLHGGVLAEDPRFAEMPAFSTIAAMARLEVLTTLFTSEIDLLTTWLAELTAHIPEGRDVAISGLRQALCAVSSALPVYRTYRTGKTLSPADRASIVAALEVAKAQCADQAALQALGRILLAQDEVGTVLPAHAWQRWILRWQQLTGAAMAKGVEDTALYRDPRLLALNDVGCDPSSGPLSVEDFHRWCQERQVRQPRALNALSTHDTKRSEDVRARLLALAQLSDLWASTLKAVRAALSPLRRYFNEGTPLHPSLELLALQTFVAAWPLQPRELSAFRQRFVDYLLKAAREAKLETSWLTPNPAYEEAIAAFASQLVEGSEGAEIRRMLMPVSETVAWTGALISLAQRAISCTAPGIPDIYQGCEGWVFALVDPDNRRPVDFTMLGKQLASLGSPEQPTPHLAHDLIHHWQDGRVKLFLTRQALFLRHSHPAVFLEGEYVPLLAEGPQRHLVLAFARVYDRQWVITLAVRFPASIDQNAMRDHRLPDPTLWSGTTVCLPPEAPRRWRSVLTGRTLTTTSAGTMLSLPDVFAMWPVEILQNEVE